MRKAHQPQSENKEHADNPILPWALFSDSMPDQTVAVAEINMNNGNLSRRKVDACDPLTGPRDCQLRGGVLDDELKFELR